MSFKGNLIGQKALKAHGNGDYETALALYKQAFESGMDKVRLLRGYAILLIRLGHSDRALDVLKKLEHVPGLAPKDKADLHVNYAIVLWQKGHLDRAMEILEDEFSRMKNGTMYSVIGYLKIEQGDAQEALRFNQEALEYDDSDPVFLDNLGQTYYRLLQDKETARPYFERAIALKPTAIDTNYFLALYDIEAGDKQQAKARLETARKGNFSTLNFATPQKIDALLDQLEA